ncbi:hypothetical protein CAEBREN_11171 [Caenorhabditis brenneri]|uniref:Uncharacterized protein n=1 Tax=Caenorhabditis brenneri TaxID=135651 RepID=G0MIS6_CAEBE|nr:hypothetical protein CAEBREN_11171 [Caenorhabditis brenneri]
MVAAPEDIPSPPINTALGPIATVEDFLGFIAKFDQAPDLTNFIIPLPQRDYVMYFEYKKMLQEMPQTNGNRTEIIKERILKIMDQRRIHDLESMISMEEENAEEDVYDGIEPMIEIELEGEIMQLRRLELPMAEDVNGEEDDYDYYDGIKPMELFDLEGEIMELHAVVSAN